MDPDPTEFAALRRLLALKRHEVPPPGFFDRLPDRIRARVMAEADEAARSWWLRLRDSLAWRPALAGAVALSAVGMVVWRAAVSQPHGAHLAPIIAQDDSSFFAQVPVPLEPAPSVSLSAAAFEVGPGQEKSSLSLYHGTPPPEDLFRPRIGRGLRRASNLATLTNVLWP